MQRVMDTGADKSTRKLRAVMDATGKRTARVCGSRKQKVGRFALRLSTCKEVTFAGAIEAYNAIVHGTERPTDRFFTVRLEAMDLDKLDVHFAARFTLAESSRGNPEAADLCKEEERGRPRPLSAGPKRAERGHATQCAGAGAGAGAGASRRRSLRPAA